MQKKIIALALAAMASGAAFAQSNVTIYGIVDVGFVNRGQGSGGTPAPVANTNEIASGVSTGSRLGFKGAEDLGNGLKAIFETEFGTDIDSTNASQSAATWKNRHSYLGLTGNFGTAVAGRLDGVRYGIFNKYDAFAGGTVGNFTQMTGQVDRANNAIAYISPNLSGFTVTVAAATNIGSTNPFGDSTIVTGAGLTVPLTAQEAVGNKGDARLATLAVNYANGPLDVTFDIEQVKFKENSASAATAVANALDKDDVMTVAGSYDFGVAKVRALWDQQKVGLRAGGDAMKIQSWFVSASVPVSAKTTLKATYGQTKDKVADAAGDDTKSSKYGLGVQYDLSKRTALYADYGRIHNGNDAWHGISYLGNSGDARANEVYGTRGFDFGLRHSF